MEKLTLLQHLEARLLGEAVRVVHIIHGVDAALRLRRSLQKHLPLHVVRIFVEESILFLQLLVYLTDQLESFFRLVNI